MKVKKIVWQNYGNNYYYDGYIDLTNERSTRLFNIRRPIRKPYILTAYLPDTKTFSFTDIESAKKKAQKLLETFVNGMITGGKI